LGEIIQSNLITAYKLLLLLPCYCCCAFII